MSDPVLDNMDGQYQWRERRFYIDKGTPEGKVWAVREMFSWGPELDRFVPHLLAMGEGLERARYAEYDYEDGAGDPVDEDNYGIFVIGLRPRTATDQTAAEQTAIRREEHERELLAELLAKHLPDSQEHFVTFSDAGWFIEHSVACRLAGTLATCEYQAYVFDVADHISPPDYGRYKIVEAGAPGVFRHEWAEPVP